MKYLLLLLLVTKSALAYAGAFSPIYEPLLDFGANTFIDGSLKLPKEQKKEVNCLAKAIFFEARGESRHAKQLVSDAVVNRAKFGKPFSNSICGVVYQKGQFSWTVEKWKRNTDFRSVALKFDKNERKAVQDSLKIALYYVILKPKNTGNITHFASNNVKFANTKYVTSAGNFKFYSYEGNS